MGRTLFLNRQRATKVLGRGTSGRPRRVAVAGPVANALRETFELAEVELIDPARAGEGGIVIMTDPSIARAGPSNVAWLRGTRSSLGSFGTESGVWVSDATESGRSVEVCLSSAPLPIDAAALDIVRWLNAVPLITRKVAFLQSLENMQPAILGYDPEDRLLAIALQSARIWRGGSIDDTQLADTAAVIAGFMPAYTGGPFAYLRHCDFADVRARANRAGQKYGALFDIPDDCEELLGMHPAVNA
jgi:hypothetical protein